jgi:hypothetical protein
MESLDWRDRSSWQVAFEAAVLQAPDQDRAKFEWQLFIEKVCRKPELTGPDLVFHPEMPFLWRTSNRDCIEGIADLVVFDPVTKGGSWWIGKLTISNRRTYSH